MFERSLNRGNREQFWTFPAFHGSIDQQGRNTYRTPGSVSRRPVFCPLLSCGSRGCTNPSEKGGSKSTSPSKSPKHARLRQSRIFRPGTHVPVGRRPRRNGNPCSNYILLEVRSLTSHISHLKCFVFLPIVAISY
jgi:hypothetical protein